MAGPPKKTPRKRPAPTTETFIFAIGGWEPEYSFAVNHSRLEDGPYWEHAGLTLTAACVYPPKLAGRTATLRFVGDRERLLARPPMKDRDWRPTGVGLLELTPSRGDFYARIPMDAVWGLIVAMGQAGFSYVLLRGPTLFRSKSLCTSFSFERTVDLEEY